LFFDAIVATVSGGVVTVILPLPEEVHYHFPSSSGLVVRKMFSTTGQKGQSTSGRQKMAKIKC